MTIRTRALLLPATMLLGSCVLTSPVSVAPSVAGPLFPKYRAASESEYSPFLLGGTATIRGQAFLRTKGGDVRVGAGSTATLDPATTTARDWFGQVGRVANRFDEAPAEPLFAKARKSAVIDAQGNFTFPNLAPGTYIARSIVTWEVAGVAQGGLVADTVTVAAGETKSVILHTVETEFSATNDAGYGPPVVTADQAKERSYTVIKHVTSSFPSCRTSSILLDRDAATLILRNNAKDAGADAIVGAGCISKTNMLDTSACSSLIECQGAAIRWSR